MRSAVGAKLIEGTFVVGDIVGTLDVDGSALLLGKSLGFKEGDWLSVGSCEGWFDGCILIDGTSLGLKEGD